MRTALLFAACALAPAASFALADGPAGEMDKAVALRVQKRYPEAIAALKAFADKYATNAEARSESFYQRGLVHEEAGSLADAAEAFGTASREFPGQPSAPFAWMALARVKARMNDPAGAMEAYDTILRQYPRHGASALAGMADLREAQGLNGEAALLVRTLLHDFPVSVEAKAARGRLAALCSRIAAVPPTATAWSDVLGRCECLLDEGKPAEADKLCGASLRKSPPADWKVELLMARGRCEVARERYPQSERLFRQAARLAGKSPRAAAARMAIVQGRLDRNRLKEAVGELDGIASDYPGTVQGEQARMTAGACYEALGDRKRAQEEYRKVMDSQSPFSDEAQRNMMRLMEAR